MVEAKLVVIYPRPTDIEAFEKKIYLTEHVPMAVKKLIGKTKIVATKITASPQGQPSSCSRAGSCANLATKKWQSTGPLTGTANRGCPRWFGRAKFRLMASRPTLSRLSIDMGNGCTNPRSLSFSSSAKPAESWWPGGVASLPDHGQTNRWSP
jgi:hypothetical protein